METKELTESLIMQVAHDMYYDDWYENNDGAPTLWEDASNEVRGYWIKGAVDLLSASDTISVTYLGDA